MAHCEQVVATTFSSPRLRAPGLYFIAHLKNERPYKDEDRAARCCTGAQQWGNAQEHVDKVKERATWGLHLLETLISAQCLEFASQSRDKPMYVCTHKPTVD